MEFEIIKRYKRKMDIETKKENTANAYVTDVKTFLEYTENKLHTNNEEKLIEYLIPINCEDLFLQMSEERKYTMTTYNRKVISLQKFGKYLVSLGLVNINPFGSLGTYKPSIVREEKNKRQQKEILTNDEVKKVIEYSYIEKNKLKASRTRFILALMTTTGMRISEVLNMKKEDIEESDYGYMINVNEHKTSDTNGSKRVPMVDKVKKYYDEYMEELNSSIKKKTNHFNSDGTIILSNTFKKMNRTQTSRDIESLVKSTGINKTIHNHNQRATFRTTLSYNGVNETIIRQIGGWSLSDVEKRYVYDENEDLKKQEICNIL